MGTPHDPHPEPDLSPLLVALAQDAADTLDAPGSPLRDAPWEARRPLCAAREKAHGNAAPARPRGRPRLFLEERQGRRRKQWARQRRRQRILEKARNGRREMRAYVRLTTLAALKRQARREGRPLCEIVERAAFLYCTVMTGRAAFTPGPQAALGDDLPLPPIPESARPLRAQPPGLPAASIRAAAVSTPPFPPPALPQGPRVAGAPGSAVPDPLDALPPPPIPDGARRRGQQPESSPPASHEGGILEWGAGGRGCARVVCGQTPAWGEARRRDLSASPLPSAVLHGGPPPAPPAPASHPPAQGDQDRGEACAVGQQPQGGPAQVHPRHPPRQEPQPPGGEPHEGQTSHHQDGPRGLQGRRQVEQCPVERPLAEPAHIPAHGRPLPAASRGPPPCDVSQEQGRGGGRPPRPSRFLALRRLRWAGFPGHPGRGRDRPQGRPQAGRHRPPGGLTVPASMRDRLSRVMPTGPPGRLG